VAGTGPGDLHALATEFLNACAEALDTIPDYADTATLLGAPDRQFVAPGIVALDCCDQLAVYVSSITMREFASGASGHIIDVQMVSTFSRCVPMPDQNGNPPTAAEQHASGAQINADKWAIWNYLHFLVREGELFEKCCGVNWIGLDALSPSGGCGGSTLTLGVCFDGYEVVQGT
jgi:hypothetical protein